MDATLSRMEDLTALLEEQSLDGAAMPEGFLMRLTAVKKAVERLMCRIADDVAPRGVKSPELEVSAASGMGAKEAAQFVRAGRTLRSHSNREAALEKQLGVHELDMIGTISNKIRPGASMSKAQVISAVLMGKERTVEGIRKHAHGLVKKAHADLERTVRKSTIKLGPLNSDGGRRVDWYQDQDTVMYFESVLAPIINKMDAKIPYERRLAMALEQALKEGGVRGVMLRVGTTLEDLQNIHENVEFFTDGDTVLLRKELAQILRVYEDENRVEIVVQGEDGSVQGIHELRNASALHREVLTILYGGCVADDCEAPPLKVQVHHIEEVSAGGSLAIDNTVPVCPPHHGEQKNPRRFGQVGTDEEGNAYTDFPDGRRKYKQGHRHDNSLRAKRKRITESREQTGNPPRPGDKAREDKEK
ncbi:MAG: HNH endonuclease signature motif containing protein [Corynebacterium sp.]|nr:HNH endonuclease signature motif containing protein [Corynebacterium sp.]